MKKLILFFTCIQFICVITTYAQRDKKNLIGAHFALGTDEYYWSIPGWGGYEAKYYFSTGLDYSRMLSKRWDICTGLKYTRSNMNSFPAPGLGSSSSDFNLQLATIPVQMKFHFGKFFYINGGLLFNILARTNEEVWVPPYKAPTNKINLLLGCGLGIGFKYELNSDIVLFLNPYFTWNGIENINDGQSFLKFLQKNEHYVSPRYLQGGVNLGIGYKF